MSAACPLLGQGSRFIIQLRCFMVEGVDSRLVKKGPVLIILLGQNLLRERRSGPKLKEGTIPNPRLGGWSLCA